MQTLVGLMCWLAAKVTRSPFFARFDRVGQVADADQVALVEQRDAVGSPSSRSPRSTLSAIGWSDGSLINERSSRTGMGTAYSSNRLMASVTLWPPNPKQLLSTASHLALHGLFGV